MKKKLFLSMMLSVFLAIAATAGAATFDFAFISSEFRHYAAPFTTPDQYLMTTSAVVSDTTNYVYLKKENLPNPGLLNDVKLNWTPGWDDFFQYQASAGFFPSPPPPPGYAVPGPSWEHSYTFYIDSLVQNGQWNEGEPTHNTWDIPSNTISQMGVPLTVTITGGIHPTITWAGVASADWYRVRLFPIAGGNPNRADLLDQSERIMNTSSPSYSFQYMGTAFETYGTLAVAVESMDQAGQPLYPLWINRSVYYLEHNPVPIPGAVWLLGSGLVGLVGFRRKFKQ